MKMVHVSSLALAGALLLCLSAANAATTSKDIDVVVTHAGGGGGGALTTFTFQNDSGTILAAGTPVTFGQAFAYGDVMPGTYPVIRDVTTHAPLAGQQWDEIDTFHENGSNSSWRHAVWSAWLPSSLAAGATYTVEFAVTAGTYSAASKQSLSALCSGPGAHDLKVDFADVRNQDDTPRDSGHAVFRVCDNIANTGRDAPRHLRSGPVGDEYEVRGIPVYAGTAHQDPLLYLICDIDLFTDAADGASLKDVKHVCTVHNSWMTVADGKTGHAGNPGPAGFHNDPQTVSYIASLYDGSAKILDWSGLNATLNSADNPIKSGNCPDGFQGSTTMTVPSSMGQNVWYAGQTVRVSATGTAIGGLTPGRPYWVYNCGITNTGGTTTNVIQLTDITQIATTWSGRGILTNSQGSGSTTFTTYFWHSPLEAWLTMDQSADENWTTRGSTTRFTRRVYPAMSKAEVKYWETTGLFMPLNLDQPTPTVSIPYSQQLYPLFFPFARGVLQGGNGGGERNDLGYVNELAAAAQILQTQDAWYLARLATMGTLTHGLSSVLDEATGRIPAVNNGPPTGPGGNGVGGTYSDPAIGLTITPHHEPSWGGSWYFLAQPSDVAPAGAAASAPANFPWHCGQWGNCGTYVSHMPNFDSYSYMLWGSRPLLDMIYLHANRDLLMRPTDGNNTSWRDYTLSDGNRYYGIFTNCCQFRGSAWSGRDFTHAAMLGGDANNSFERAYFNDIITENINEYHIGIGASEWGKGSEDYRTSIGGADEDGTVSGQEGFIDQYLVDAFSWMGVLLHAPTEEDIILTTQIKYEGGCGGRLYGHLSQYWCPQYWYDTAYHDGDLPEDVTGANGVDATDWGINHWAVTIGSNGLLSFYGGGLPYPIASGDTVKNMPVYGSDPLDQIPGKQWFAIANVNAATGTFQLMCPTGHPVDATCPTPGQPFTDYTHGGKSVANNYVQNMKFRINADQPTGFYDGNYVPYLGSLMQKLAITGHDMSQSLATFTARGGEGYFNTNRPNQWMDTSIVIPGIPAVVTYGNQFPTVACNVAAGTVVSSLGLNRGNGAAASGWALNGIGDTADFAVSGANLIVGSKGIDHSRCNSSQVVRVQGTQSGGKPVVGQVNVRIGP